MPKPMTILRAVPCKAESAHGRQQSRPLESRFALEKAAAKYAAKFALGTVPRPPYWIGYRIAPVAIEFWSDGASRLHDRIVFTRATPRRLAKAAALPVCLIKLAFERRVRMSA